MTPAEQTVLALLRDAPLRTGEVTFKLVVLDLAPKSEARPGWSFCWTAALLSSLRKQGLVRSQPVRHENRDKRLWSLVQQ